MATTSTYEPFTGRLAALATSSVVGPQGVPIQRLAYTYTPNGNLATRRNSLTPRFEQFQYDNLDRLTSVARDNQPEVFVAGYDFRGRMTFKVDVGVYDYTHPAGVPAPLHAPRGIVKGGVTRTFLYDASGNELERRDGPEGVRTTEYNSFNLPLSITDTLPQPSATSFEYDGDRVRVLKLENGVRQTLYAGNLYERLTEGLGGGAPVVTHKYRIFAEGRQIAQLERRQGTADNLVYLHVDHLGSTQVVTQGTPDASSDLVLHEQTFDPWGQVEGTATWETSLGASNVRTGFTGHEHDPEHRLVNMRGRMYDPELGRFTTADPIVQAPFYSQSFNRYAYVFNNPLAYVDPSGFLGTASASGVPEWSVDKSGTITFLALSVRAWIVTSATVTPSTASSKVGKKPPTPERIIEQGPPVDQGEPSSAGQARLNADRAFRGAPPPRALTSSTATGRGGGEGGGGGGSGGAGGGSSTGAHGTAGMGAGETFHYTGHDYATLGGEYLRELTFAIATTLLPGGFAMALERSLLARSVVAAERALVAADLGLSGVGILELAGSVTSAGSTRIIQVANIRAVAGALAPELRGALPKMLDAARTEGIRTLQITGSFANSAFADFAAREAAAYGGTYASVGGHETITFLLGAP